MTEILLNASLKEKLSKKGTNYYVVEIELTPGCAKEVFLEKSEIELVKLFYSVNKNGNK